MTHAEGLLDTSVFIASESGRQLRRESLPTEVAVCVVTVAELRAGVLAARDTATRARRLQTLDQVSRLAPLPIDGTAAAVWADLRVRLAEAGRRLNVNDLWIASVAVANGLPLFTQDADFDPLSDLGGPEVVRV